MMRALKNALKMTVAVMLAAWAHDALHVSDPLRKSWTVLTAVIVMMSNLGASFKASGDRLIGTAIGAMIGAAFSYVHRLGHIANFGEEIRLAGLGLAMGSAVLICTALGIKTSLRLALSTLAVVLFVAAANLKEEPWQIALERSLDSVIGIAAALLTQFLVFPQPAERELCQALIKALDGAATMLQESADLYLRGQEPKSAAADLHTELVAQQQQGIALLIDLASEPGMLDKERQRLMTLVAGVGDLIERLSALYQAARAAPPSDFQTKKNRMGPELAELSNQSRESLLWLSANLGVKKRVPPPDLKKALFQVETRFVQICEEGLTKCYTGSDLVHFCSFLFNLREVARQTVSLIDTAESTAKPDRLKNPQRDKELEKAYRATGYEVDGPAGKFTLRIDAVSPELEDLLRESGKTTWAYLTAYNPDSQPRGDAENQEQQRLLEAELRATGNPVYPGRGVSDEGDWPPEPSFLVLGIERSAALLLARRYGQRAILYGVAGGKVELG